MRTLIISFLLILSSCIISFSQTVDVNASNFQAYASGNILDAALQTDGKIILVGDFEFFNGTVAKNIVRLNSDGSIDNTFNTGTGPSNLPFVNNITSILLLESGKILVRGSFESFNGVPRYRLVRLNSNGSVDTSFVPPSNPNNNSAPFNLALAANNNAVLYSYITNAGYFIGKLNNDGAVDPTFNIGSGFNGDIVGLEFQPDGKILVGGIFTQFNGQSVGNFVRLNSDGSFESSFGTGANNLVTKVRYSSFNKIILTGMFTTFNGQNAASIVVLNLDGTRDNSILFSGSPKASDAVFTSPSEIVVGGGFARTSRYSSLPNNTMQYTPANSNQQDIINKVLIQPDGKIVLIGSPSSLSNVIYRLNADLTLDATFNTGIGAGIPARIYQTATQPDGKIILTGNFAYLKGEEKKGIARLNNDFTLDGSFNSGTGFFPNKNNFFYSLTTQADGKIIVQGQFDGYNGNPTGRMVRLNADGTLDNSFVSDGAQFFCTLCGVFFKVITYVQSDGSYLIGGSFLSFGDQPRKYLVRILSNGDLDASFNPNLDGPVTAMALQPDGKILITGNFNTLNGTAVNNKLIRLNSNGTLDATFTSALLTSGTSINQIYVTESNKIILGGSLTISANNTYPCVRLEPNGTLDASFNLGNTGSGSVYILKDNTLLVRTFETLRRVDSQGIPDLDFNPVPITGIGQVSVENVLVIDPNKLLITGFFNNINNRNVWNAAVLLYDLFPPLPDAPTNLQALPVENDYPTLTWNDNSTVETSYEIYRSQTNNSNFVILTTLPANAQSYQDKTATNRSIYYYKVGARNKSGFSGFSNEVMVNILITDLEKSSPDKVSVYPNPTNNLLNIKFDMSLPTNEIVIYDLSGKECLRHTVSESDITISIETLPQGIYLLNIDGYGNSFIKVIKN